MHGSLLVKLEMMLVLVLPLGDELRIEDSRKESALLSSGK